MAKRSLHYLLIFLITLLCIVANPGFATTPVIDAPIEITSDSAQQLEQQGRALYDAGRFVEAIPVLQQAARQYQQQGDLLRQAIVLSNLALTYEQRGIWTDAVDANTASQSELEWTNANTAIKASLELLDSSTISGTTAYTTVKAQILDVQGRLQFTQGQAGAALESWQQAAQLYDRSGDTEGLVRNKIDQSRALQSLGFSRRSIDLLTEILKLPSQVPVEPENQLGTEPSSVVSLEELLGLKTSIFTRETLRSSLSQLLQTLPATPTTAVALQNLGEALQSSSSLVQAEAVLQRSLAIAEQETTASVLLDLGNVARAQASASLDRDDPTRAQAEIDCALDYYRRAENGAETAIIVRSQLNQLRLLIDQNQWAKAQLLLPSIHQNQWAEAQLLLPSIHQNLKALPLNQLTIYAQSNFARSLTKGLNHLSVNPELEASSLALYTAQLLATAEQQATELKDWRSVAYARGSLGKLYQETQQWDEAQDLTQQAIQLAQEKANAPDITYLWQWQLGQILKIKSERSSDALEKQEYITDATLAYQAALQTLESIRYDLTSVSRDEQFNFRDTIEPAYRELIALLLESPNSTPSQNSLSTARTTLESLQVAELLNFFRQACEISPVEIDRIVEETNSSAAIIYPIILPDKLHVILKLPGQDQLYHHTLSISATKVKTTLDELYNKLLLLEEQSSVKQLAQDVYCWLIRPREAELANNDIKTLVFVLDGVFQRIPMAVLHDGNHYLVEQYSVTLAQGLKIPDPEPLARDNIRLLLAGLSEQVAGEEFSELPSVKLETEKIHEEIPRSTVLLNEQFTAAALQRQIENTPFQVVHLATHGIFSANQDETFILAADRRINVSEIDQVLRTRERTQSNPIELLVLSACETAQGNNRAALGLSGVAVRAGARSTIGTLWSVNDEKSANLMVEFYRQWKDHPEYTKAEALQQAQIAGLRAYEYPYYWAPFVLLGNWL